MNIYIKEESFIDLIFGDNEQMLNDFIKLRNLCPQADIQELLKSGLSLATILVLATDEERKNIIDSMKPVVERNTEINPF